MHALHHAGNLPLAPGPVFSFSISGLVWHLSAPGRQPHRLHPAVTLGPEAPGRPCAPGRPAMPASPWGREEMKQRKKQSEQARKGACRVGQQRWEGSCTQVPTCQASLGEKHLSASRMLRVQKVRIEGNGPTIPYPSRASIFTQLFALFSLSSTHSPGRIFSPPFTHSFHLSQGKVAALGSFLQPERGLLAQQVN